MDGRDRGLPARVGFSLLIAANVASLIRERRDVTIPISVACDVCGGVAASLWRSALEVADDLSRAHRGIDDVVLDNSVGIYRCHECGSLFRDPSEVPVDLTSMYAADAYPSPRIERLRDRAYADLDLDRRRGRLPGVDPGARLLEIGSYAGAFLDVARERGCAVTGIDANPDLVAHARARGHDARVMPFAAGEFARHEFDGVFILNCFEALPDLDGVAREVQRLLRPGGTLVVRTPNATFVRVAHADDARRWLGAAADANALLGVPYRRCLTPATLVGLLQRHGFDDVDVRGREFSALRPAGWSRAWSAARPLRNLGYAVASLVARQPVYPWLHVVARASSPRQRRRVTVCTPRESGTPLSTTTARGDAMPASARGSPTASPDG